MRGGSQRPRIATGSDLNALILIRIKFTRGRGDARPP